MTSSLLDYIYKVAIYKSSYSSHILCRHEFGGEHPVREYFGKLECYFPPPHIEVTKISFTVIEPLVFKLDLKFRCHWREILVLKFILSCK